jgi:hypothetical protein
LVPNIRTPQPNSVQVACRISLPAQRFNFQTQSKEQQSYAAMPRMDLAPIETQSGSEGSNFSETTSLLQRRVSIRTTSEEQSADPALQPQPLFWSLLFTGLFIGTFTCIANTYFGLQTGRSNGLPLATAVLANWVSAILRKSLSMADNVFVVTVATSVAAMPIVAGLIGVIPALEYLAAEDGYEALKATWAQLVAWAIGICLPGPFLSRLLQQNSGILKSLPFPNGTALALVIRKYHARNTGLEIPAMVNVSAGDGQHTENPHCSRIEVVNEVEDYSNNRLCPPPPLESFGSPPMFGTKAFFFWSTVSGVSVGFIPRTHDIQHMY